MPPPLSPRRRLLLFAAVPLVATVLALAAAELVLRWLAPAPRVLGKLHYETLAGERVDDYATGAAKGFLVPAPGQVAQRGRFMFAPGSRFYLCYGDAGELRRPWLDEQGRVLVAINQHGLRERDELGLDKPAGEQRVVCVGDSFTFGWGVRDEDGWVRRLEVDLRAGGRNVRTVNCGAAGALCVDEYWWALRDRFAAFQPDAVVVTICLNDLIPSSGLFVQGPVRSSGLLLVDRLRLALGADPLALDPAVDWVGLLLGLPEADGTAGGLYGHDKPFAGMWSQGAPQAALAAMKAWSEERKVPLMIVLWPFLQGLGPARHYPFGRLHELVAAECRRLGLPFLDLLPELAGTRAEELWVTPADMHANPRAHALVGPALRRFVAQTCGW